MYIHISFSLSLYIYIYIYIFPPDRREVPLPGTLLAPCDSLAARVGRARTSSEPGIYIYIYVYLFIY